MIDAVCSCSSSWMLNGIGMSNQQVILNMVEHWKLGHVVRARKGSFVAIVLEARKLKDTQDGNSMRF